MGVRPSATRPGATNPDSEATVPQSVSHYRTRPGRFVFIEADNPDGWIATDLTVDPDQ